MRLLARYWRVTDVEAIEQARAWLDSEPKVTAYTVRGIAQGNDDPLYGWRDVEVDVVFGTDAQSPLFTERASS